MNQLVNHKKEYVFGGDKSLVSDVFTGLRAKLASLSMNKNKNDGSSARNLDSFSIKNSQT